MTNPVYYWTKSIGYRAVLKGLSLKYLIHLTVRICTVISLSLLMSDAHAAPQSPWTKLPEVASELAQEIRRATPEIFQKFPAGTRTKLASIIESVRSSPGVNRQRAGRLLMFDYGVDSRGTYIEALEPFSVAYEPVVTSWNSNHADGLKIKLLHEAAHHLGYLKDEDADRIAKAIFSSLINDLLRCNAGQIQLHYDHFAAAPVITLTHTPIESLDKENTSAAALSGKFQKMPTYHPVFLIRRTDLTVITVQADLNLYRKWAAYHQCGEDRWVSAVFPDCFFASQDYFDTRAFTKSEQMKQYPATSFRLHWSDNDLSVESWIRLAGEGIQLQNGFTSIKVGQENNYQSGTFAAAFAHPGGSSTVNYQGPLVCKASFTVVEP